MDPVTGLTTAQCLTAIERHSAGLAAASRGNFGARVEHCPDWSVADLVWHVRGVHWFWATIAEQRPREVPEELLQEENRPSRPDDEEEMLAELEAGAEHLVHVLRAADQSAACWTWAPQQQDIAFITRHQVQEAAVHHWDAANAREGGAPWAIDPAVAADAVEEFLSFSVSSEADPAQPPRPPLDGAIWIRARTGPTWLVRDGAVPGTVRWERLAAGAEPAHLAAHVPLVGGHAAPADVLLWLYGRTPSLFEDGPTGDPAVLERFRALTFTD